MKKVIVFAANGFIGNELLDFFLAKENYQVIAVARKEIKKNAPNFKSVLWDGVNLGAWKNELENADLLLNLTGRSVNCRYTADNKTEIYQSRIFSVRAIGKAISECENPPKVWMNFASATIYMHSYVPNDEENGIIGSGFSVDVCKRWEETFFEQNTPQTRKINFRTAIVLGKSGGVFPVLKKLSKRGLGGTMGNGKQYFSWIHIEDLCRVVEFIFQNENLEGTFNLSAPNPIPNKELQKLIRKGNLFSLNIPQPKFILELGARLIKTETELILKSRFVVPTRLVDAHFKFIHSNIETCIASFC